MSYFGQQTALIIQNADEGSGRYGLGSGRALSFSPTMNSRNRSFSVWLGFQWLWVVPAGVLDDQTVCQT
jgi:hypothetical protein